MLHTKTASTLNTIWMLTSEITAAIQIGSIGAYLSGIFSKQTPILYWYTLAIITAKLFFTITASTILIISAKLMMAINKYQFNIVIIKVGIVRLTVQFIRLINTIKKVIAPSICRYTLTGMTTYSIWWTTMFGAIDFITFIITIK